MKVSLIIPVFNEQGNIGPLVNNLHKILTTKFELELIVVDDCSTDGTVDEIDTNLCKLLRHKCNQGKGVAMKTGIKEAKGDIIGFIDGDAQDDPADILNIVNEIQKGADLVIGSRFKIITQFADKENSVKRYTKEAVLPINEAGNKLLTVLINKIFKAQFSDVCASLRFYKADVLKRMKIESKRFEIETEMAIRAIRMNLNIVEVPVHRYQRIHGKSFLYEVPFGRTKFAFRVLKVIVKGIIFWK